MNSNSNINSFFSTDVKGSFFSQFLNKELLKKKIKAFSVHFLLSIVLISSFFSFAILQWFPNSSLELSGIKDVLYIIIGADLLLGPALTFLVFNPVKKSLKFDLSAILVLQLSMFLFGVYTVYIAHPVYITFTVDRFTLVSARDADPSKTNIKEYQISKFSKPVYAYVESPKNIEEKNSILFNSVGGGLDLDAYAKYYLPYQENIKNIIARKLPPEKIFFTKEQKQLFASYLQENHLKYNDIALLPVQGKAKFMTYVIDIKTAKPIHIFDIDPWE